ncbi:MAG: PepSY domain-containing protein [Peptococcaceae bacterium]|jgi:uncharacterized membrane protein YkoI|nr:PepSY domain-containing protein [Peptococcaceae bacterium]
MTKKMAAIADTGRKNRRLTTVYVMILLLAAVPPVHALAAPTGAGQYIGEARAKSIALEHAGVSEDQTAFIRVHLDYGGRRVDYDIDFYAGSTKYEYEVDAVSGDILEFDQETKRAAGAGDSAAGQTGAGAGQYIGETQAKSIALSSAELTESQVRGMKVKLDREHGKTVYEVEFKSGRTEYEYDIDATSGAILESDIEYDD